MAYYHTKADPIFWDSHWSKLINKVEWEKAENGLLGWFEEPFIKYLPKTGKIVEAGCGLGYYVLALDRRGYNIEGVEWSRKSIKLINKRYPNLQVKAGDVRKLTVKDGYYSGYISLGVMEHSQSGPEDYLKEAYRVLKRGGVAIISVPYFNLLRRLKSLIGFYSGDPRGQDFYQYAFLEMEIDRLIKKAGFKVIKHINYDAYKCVKDDLPFLRNLLSMLSVIIGPAEGSSKATMVGRQRSYASVRPWWLKLADKYFGHMTMAICIKP